VSGRAEDPGTPDSLAAVAASAAVAAAVESLAAEAGLDAVALGERAVERAVRARLATTGLISSAWVDRLRRDVAERTALIDAVVVPETQLFRDGTPFEALFAMAEARAGHPRQRLRVLSAACSTGEEPYSVAISLLAGGLTADAVEVVALDVSASALAIATGGVLGRTALRGSIPPWAEPWLERRPDGTVAIAPVARETVTFRVANVLAAPSDGPYDAILCRNLLIYLTAPARTRVTGWLQAQLGPGAPLFVGHAEVGVLLGAGWRRASGFGPYALEPIEPVVPPKRDTDARAPSAPVAAPAQPAPGAAGQGASARALPAGSVAGSPDAAPTTPGADVPADQLLARAGALAESGAREEAVRLLVELTRDAPWDVEAHALLGVLHATAGRPEDARHALRRALYLDPDHAESRAQLALLDAGSARTGRP